MLFAFEKSIGAVLYRREPEGGVKYLLLHYVSGHWDFPKGHVEKGETEEGTIKREIKEETGIENVKIIPGFRKLIYYFYRAKGTEKEKRIEQGRGIWIFKRVYYYIAETEEIEAQIPQGSYEHTEYQWVNYEKAVEMVTFDNAKNILKEANKFLK